MNEIKPFYTYFSLFALIMAVVFLPFSVKICHLALFLLILSWILQAHWKEKWNSIISSPIIITFIIFFLLHFIGLFYTEDKANGWFAIEKKAFWIIIPIVLASMPRLEKKYLDLVFLFFISACFLGTVICLFNATSLLASNSGADPLSSSLFKLLNPDSPKQWMYFSYIDLSSGIGLHPTYFSMYLIFCLMLLFRLFHKNFFSLSKTFKIILIALSFYFGFFIICLSSRVTTLAFLFFVFIGVCVLFQKVSSVRKLVYSFLAIFFLILLIYFNPVSRYRNYQEVAHISYPQSHGKPYALSADIHASLWWVGLKSTMDINLLWGVGTGGVEDLMKNAGIRYGITNILKTNDPHNQFLYTTLSLGLIGLFSFLSCLIWPIYLAYQRQDFFYVAFVCLFVFVSLTETVLEAQKGIVFFSLFNSILMFQCADWSIFYKRKFSYG